MNHLIVYAHPNPDSFNHAILETGVNALKKNGHEVVIRDLYALDFQPTLKAEEIKSLEAGHTPKDVKVEQEYITQADVITFIYPIWWAGPPAILRGYIDRVFSHGFAYGSDETGTIKMLMGKKGVVINTFGAPEDFYDETGMTDALRIVSNIGIFDFVGIEPVEHLLFGGVGSLDTEAYIGILKKVEDTMNSHFPHA